MDSVVAELLGDQSSYGQSEYRQPQCLALQSIQQHITQLWHPGSIVFMPDLALLAGSGECPAGQARYDHKDAIAGPWYAASAGPSLLLTGRCPDGLPCMSASMGDGSQHCNCTQQATMWLLCRVIMRQVKACSCCLDTLQSACVASL